MKALHSRIRRPTDVEVEVLPNSMGRPMTGTKQQQQQNQRAKLISSSSRRRNDNTRKRLICLFGISILLIWFILLNSGISFHSHHHHYDHRTSSSLSSSEWNTMLGNHQRLTIPQIEEPLPENKNKDPDGTFGGYPIYHRRIPPPPPDDTLHDTKRATTQQQQQPSTLVHCKGQNWKRDDWKHRSCHFTFFCFNVSSKTFQIYPRREEDTYLERWSRHVSLMDVSESLVTNTTFLSLGGINMKWGRDGISRLKWFPNIVTSPPPTDFYILPTQVVMVPYHSLGGWNPGHAVWDDFLPIWSLLDLFQLPNQDILPLRFILDDGEPPLWASCDSPTKKDGCQILQRKFLPLLHNQTMTTTTTQQDIQIEMNIKDSIPKSDLICSKHGAAGIGDLTDHGLNKLHGWHEEVKYTYPVFV